MSYVDSSIVVPATFAVVEVEGGYQAKQLFKKGRKLAAPRFGLVRATFDEAVRDANLLVANTTTRLGLPAARQLSFDDIQLDQVELFPE